MKKIQPKKIVIQSFKGINVDKVLQDIKRVKRAEKEFEEAMDLHLISQNYKPARNNKGRFTKKFNWDTLGYTLTCCAISFLIAYTILG